MARIQFPTALGLSLLLGATPAVAQGQGQTQPPAQAQQQSGQAQPRGGDAAQPDDGRIAERVAGQIAQTWPQSRPSQGGLLARGWQVEGTGDLKVNVKADNGDVTLSGQLASMDQLRQAVEAARQVPGVRSVRSEVVFYAGVPQDKLQSYVDALQRMGQAEPQLLQSLQQGQPVGAEALQRVPAGQVQTALEQAKLSQEEFRRITAELQNDQSLQQRFAQVAQQQAQRSGGSQSGAQPGSSPK